MDPYPCKPLASAQAMVTREISAYCAIKCQKVDEHSPGYLDVDFEKELEAYKEKELEAYKSEDEPSCDAVPWAGKRSPSGTWAPTGSTPCWPT